VDNPNGIALNKYEGEDVDIYLFPGKSTFCSLATQHFKFSTESLPFSFKEDLPRKSDSNLIFAGSSLVSGREWWPLLPEPTVSRA
jgi:hypothetical protein